MKLQLADRWKVRKKKHKQKQKLRTGLGFFDSCHLSASFIKSLLIPVVRSPFHSETGLTGWPPVLIDTQPHTCVHMARAKHNNRPGTVTGKKAENMIITGKACRLLFNHAAHFAIAIINNSY